MNETHVRHWGAATLGAAGLVGIALIHFLDLFDKFEETPYLGVLYVFLIVGSLVTAGTLLHRPSLLAWRLTAFLAGSAFLGYVLSRTTGLPSATDDIGNWLEALGLASLFIEGGTFVLAFYGMWIARTAPIGTSGSVSSSEPPTIRARHLSH
jgi:hypothetical protein